MQETEISPDEPPADALPKPSGPAQLINQPARSAFLLKLGDETILSATVKVHREDALIPFKEAGARLFVLSRSDGWDTVHQSIRIAGIGLLPEDKLVLKGTIYGPELTLKRSVEKWLEPADEETCFRAIWSAQSDWLISIDEPSTELTLKVKAEGAVQFTAMAHEINLSYRPCVSDNLGVS